MLLRINEQIVTEAEQNLLNTEEFVGIKTGFINLDFFTDGFANGQLIILGARPSMGKTTFACSLVDNVCVKDGKSCVFYTSEMSVNRTIERIIRIHGDVKYDEKDGEVYTEKIKSASEKVKKARLWLDDTCVGNPPEFIEKCREIGKTERIDLIIIDYLQLFESDTRHLENTLGSLKELAVELDCPVFVLSQLKRSVEKRKDHFPQISDFPLPKIMEAVADEILYLYRDAYYDQDADRNSALISVARHKKHGRINTPVFFDPEIPMFRSEKSSKKRKTKKQMNARSELHCHTKMSEMTGIADVRQLIRTAKEMGMPAIAITDNETVQAFPDAFYEWWHVESENDDVNDGIKVFLGAEVGLVDDVDAIVINEKNQKIEGEYVVFDLETTGLSPVKDRIIEIGAVRLKDGKITDTFSCFVNPDIHIPEMITEITGINDEMVSEAGRIEQVLPEFVDFCQNAVLVAHNSKFVISFIRENMQRQGQNVDFTVIDTLNLSRLLLDSSKGFTLSTIADTLAIPVGNLHRAVDDSELTAKVFLSLLERLNDKGIRNLRELNAMTKGNSNLIKRLFTHREIVIATSLEGMKNLYELISISNLSYSEPFPRIPRSVLDEHRNGLIIGSCAKNGDVSRAALENQREDDIKELMGFYDFVEVEPVDNYAFLIEQLPPDHDLTKEQVKESIKKIVKLGKESSVPIIASSDVHYIKEEDIDAFRILRHAEGFSEIDGWESKHHLMTTEEMLEEFSFLGDEAKEIVIDNPSIFAEKLGVVQPINPSKNYPEYPDADEVLQEFCYKREHEIYGMKLPDIVESRIEMEIGEIKENGFAPLYMIAYEIVKKSNEAGYIVGSRGTSGASLVSFLLGISETNPLPAHYRCKKCGYVDFKVSDTAGYHYGDVGMDLPDAICPDCGEVLAKDGYDLPMETFLGFHLNKEPDFDFNLASDYQFEAQRGVVDIEGIGTICRAGTIGTMTERRAEKYVKQYYEDKKVIVDKGKISEIAEKLVGIRRCNGVHPGGIILVPEGSDIYSYTPIITGMPDGIPNTQIEYHALDGLLLKFDLLGHNTQSFLKYLYDATGIDPVTVPLEDGKVMSLFSGIEELGINSDKIGGVKVGTLGVPEFGSYSVRRALEFIRPKRFSDLIRVPSLMHATWERDPFEIIRDKGISISEFIGNRDDIMFYLIDKGVDRETAFMVMESVRKGKPCKEEWVERLLEIGVPDWYISLFEKIKYLFPKAHVANYTLMSWRLLYYKLYYPEAFYKGWLKYGAHEIDEDFVRRGYDFAKKEFDALSIKNHKKMGYRQQYKLDDLLVVMEMCSRGVHLE